MWAHVNKLLFKIVLTILGIGRLVATEYRVLPSSWYSAEPSNRTEYRFSPNLYSASSSPLLLKSAPGTARILCRNFTPKRHWQLWVKVRTWRLDWDSNPRSSGWTVSAQPMYHHVPQADNFQLCIIIYGMVSHNVITHLFLTIFVIDWDDAKTSIGLLLRECYAMWRDSFYWLFDSIGLLYYLFN